MNMNIALHGTALAVVFALALWGAANILVSIEGWLHNRVTRTGWRLRLRWDRPGAPVILPDGRMGAIEDICYSDEAGNMAIVIFEDGDPEWVPVAAMDTAPAVAEAA
jgi:hypothetical protein